MDKDMSNPSNQNIDAELLVRFLSGDANEQERNEVQQWIKASDQHKEYIDQMTMLWKSSTDAKDFTAINVQEDWQKVVKRIVEVGKIKKSKPLQNQKSMMYQLVRIAAVITIAVGLYFTIPILARQWAKPITIVAIDSPSKITLPDGSRVYLNKNSSLTYPEKLDGQAREITLKGEAFFEITKNEARPFLIKSGHAITEVVGTSFNVNNADSSTVIVTVVTGKVILYSRRNPKSKIAMTPGETGKYEDEQGLLKTANQDVNFLSWKTGTLTFRNTNLSQVVKDLNRHFNQHIELESAVLENCTLTSVFQQQTIEETLAELQLVLPIQIQKRGNSLIITGQGCNQTQ
jgi:ferric-dicitrate binding protein FerR (iron transport regulator)